MLTSDKTFICVRRVLSASLFVFGLLVSSRAQNPPRYTYNQLLPVAQEMNRIEGFSSEPTSPEAAFSRISKDFNLELYSGVLRGVRGTYLAKSGNSVDQALLLYYLITRNSPTEIEDARVAYARLSETEANPLYSKCLVGLTSRLKALQDEYHSLETQGASSDSAKQKSTIEKVKGIRAEVLSRLTNLMNGDESLLNEHLSDRNQKITSNLASQKQQMIEFARDHYWLQVRLKGKSDFIDIDPVYPGLRFGKSVKAASESFSIADLPNALLSKISFTLTATWQEGNTHTEQLLLEVTTDAASIATYPVFLIHPSKGDMFGTAGAFAAVTDALGGQRAGIPYKPVLYIGKDKFEGELMLKESGGGFLGLSGGESRPEVVAETLQIKLITPKTQRTIVRPIFDRAGISQREKPGAWSLRTMAYDKEHSPLPLQPVRSFLVTTGNLDPTVDSNHLADMPTDFLSSLFGAHYQFAVWRQTLRGIFGQGRLYGYCAEPTVTSLTLGPIVGPTKTDNTPYTATSLTADIISSSVIAPASGDLVSHGLFDGLSEQLFLEQLMYENSEQAASLFTAHNALAKASQSGVRLRWVSKPEELTELNLTPDVTTYLSDRLSQYFVLVPSSSINFFGRKRLGWLLVDRTTYQVRDEASMSMGGLATTDVSVQDETEEAELQGTMVARIKEICQFQQCLEFAYKGSRVLTMIWGKRIEVIMDVIDAYRSGKNCLAVTIKVLAKKEYQNDPGLIRKQKAIDDQTKKGLETPSRADYEKRRSEPPGGHRDSAGPNNDWDHMVELACGGLNSPENVNPLNSSINRSIGATLGRICSALCEGTKIEKVIWEYVYVNPLNGSREGGVIAIRTTPHGRVDFIIAPNSMSASTTSSRNRLDRSYYPLSPRLSNWSRN